LSEKHPANCHSVSLLNELSFHSYVKFSQALSGLIANADVLIDIDIDAVYLDHTISQRFQFLL